MGPKKKSKGKWKIPRDNKNENTTHQNLQDAVKAELQGKFINLTSNQINNQTLHLQEVGKPE